MKRFLLTSILCVLLLASFVAAKHAELAPGSAQSANLPYLNAAKDVQSTKLPLHRLVSGRHNELPPLILDTEILDSLYYDTNPAVYRYFTPNDPVTFAAMFTPPQPCSLTGLTLGNYEKERPAGLQGYMIIHIYADNLGEPGGEIISPFLVALPGASALLRTYIPLPETIDMSTDIFWIGVQEVDTNIVGDTSHTYPTWDNTTPASTYNFVLFSDDPAWYDMGASSGDLNIRAYISYYGMDMIPPVIVHTPISAGFSYDGNYVIKALITDNESMGTASVMYGLNGGAYTELVMVDSAGYYWASIPAQLPGTLVDYYLTAEDGIGNTARSPEDTTETNGFYVYVGHELKHEFGQFSGAFYIDTSDGGTDRRFAVKFTPDHYPAVLTMLRFNIVDTTAFDFAVTNDTGAPGPVIYGPEEMASPYKTGNHWLTWIIPGPQCPVITSGSFFLEFRYQDGFLDPAIGSDSSDPSLNSYFISNPDSGWHNVLTRDWMMRAVVVDTFFNHDVGVTNIDSLPDIGGRTNCDQEMWVNVFNFGNNTESFPVRLKVMDYTDTTIVIYDNSITVTGLAAKTGQLVHFPDWSQMVPGDYIVSATTQLTGDQYSYNDNDAWYFPVGHIISHAWDDGLAEAKYIVGEPTGANDMFAVKFRPIEPNFRVDAALIFAGTEDSLTNGNFEWVRICPSLNDSTPDIDNPYAESLNVEIEGDADARLIDFPQDSSVTGYNDWVWIVVKWYEGQSGTTLPGIFSDQTEPDIKSYWTNDTLNNPPNWRDDDGNDWIMRLYLAYDTCTSAISPCEYLIGDMSGDNVRGGGDVTYYVRYLKGIGLNPPDSCAHDSVNTTRGHWLYVAADVNGDCNHSGGDVTRLVAYFKGNAALSCCRFFPTTLPRVIAPIDEPLSIRHAVKLDAKRDHKLSNVMTPKAPGQR